MPSRDITHALMSVKRWEEIERAFGGNNEIHVSCKGPAMPHVRVPLGRNARRRGWVVVFSAQETQDEHAESTVKVGIHNNESIVLQEGCASTRHRIVFERETSEPAWRVNRMGSAAIVISLDPRDPVQEERAFWQQHRCFVLTQGTSCTPHWKGLYGVMRGVVNIFGEVDVTIRPSKDEKTGEKDGYEARVHVDNLSPLSPEDVYTFPVTITKNGETKRFQTGANLTMFAIAGIKNRKDIENLIKITITCEERCITDPESLVRLCEHMIAHA